MASRRGNEPELFYKAWAWASIPFKAVEHLGKTCRILVPQLKLFSLRMSVAAQLGLKGEAPTVRSPPQQPDLAMQLSPPDFSIPSPISMLRRWLGFGVILSRGQWLVLGRALIVISSYSEVFVSKGKAVLPVGAHTLPVGPSHPAG